MRDLDDLGPPPVDRRADGPRSLALTAGECRSLLEEASVGRLAFTVDGWPMVVPVNYVLVGEDIVINTDPGSKLTAASRAAPVALEVDSVDSLFRSGRSVLVHGRAEVVTDPRELDRLDRVRGFHSWDGRKTHRIRIRPLQMTGRRLPKAWRYPDPTEEDE